MPNGDHDKRGPLPEGPRQTRGKVSVDLGRLTDRYDERAAAVEITIDWDKVRQWAVGAICNRSGRKTVQGDMIVASAYDREDHRESRTP